MAKTPTSKNGSSGPNSSGGDRTPVAQLVEQRIPNPQVAGSSPSRRVDDVENGDGDHAGDDAVRTTAVDEGGHGGIYKFGQGYWVRVLTATFVGLLVLACAGWVASQLSAVDLPAPTSSVELRGASGGTLAPGDRVTLLNDSVTPPVTLGTATVQSATLSQVGDGSAILRDVKLDENHAIGETKRLLGTGSFSSVVASANPIPIFERLYLQGGAALLILLTGAIFIYYYVARKPATVDFLIAVDGEMKKVNWSTRRLIQTSTTVVIIATFLISAILFIIDYGLQTFFQAIGVLLRLK